MDKSLEELIEERKKEAKGKNFFEKASRITSYFGHPQMRDSIKNNHYFDGLFEIDSFELEPENGDWGTKIQYCGRIVFHGDRCYLDVYSYVPGEWEGEFEQLYQKARKLKRPRRERTDLRSLNRNLICNFAGFIQ